MNISFWKISAFLIFLFMENGWSRAANLIDAKIFQSFDLQNDGKNTVTDVRIEYGEYIFPIGFQSPIVGLPRFKGLSGLHQSASVPVPETAKIHWKSFDNQEHDIEVPIRGLITSWKTFHGFKFIFIDDHIELSIADHYEKPSPYGTLDYTKVYSSIDGVIKTRESLINSSGRFLQRSDLRQ